MSEDNELEPTVKMLIEKLGGSIPPCPMCKHETWGTLGAPESMIGPKVVAPDLNVEIIPSMVIVCANCGFISQHAINILHDSDVAEHKEEGA